MLSYCESALSYSGKDKVNQLCNLISLHLHLPSNPRLSFTLHHRLPELRCFIFRRSVFHQRSDLNTSKREKLQSYPYFMVENGEGELVYEGKTYELRSGDVVFIDCRKAYSHSTGNAHSVGNSNRTCDSHSVDNNILI